MISKVLAVLGFVAVAYAADLSVGNEGGKLIFEQNITASPAIWRQVQLLTVNVTNNTDELISRVVVIDNRPDKDGEATVVEGGEGQKNVTLQLKSPTVFRGFDFSVQVFATVENVYGRVPNHPVATGTETQDPQVLKDLNVNSNQEPKNDGDIIIGASAPTASSTTEVNKDDQQKVNPALVGKDQPRLNRDTEAQKTNDATSVPTPVEVVAAEDTQVNENANKPVPEMDESLKKALDSIFENTSTQKTAEEAAQKVVPVMPQAESDDLVNLRDDEENRKVREATKDTVVPVLPEELTNDNQTTPKTELSSTTQKVEQETSAPEVTSTTEKVAGQENSSSTIVPVTGEVTSTTEANKPTHLKHHHVHHVVPLPYVN